MSVLSEQKCGLGLAAMCCILFGCAIAAPGLLFQYHDDYNEDIVNGMGITGGYQYYYTQYWLGAPLIVLGVVILSFLCCKARPLLYMCIVLASLTLALAIAAIVLEGPKWGLWLSRRQAAVANGEKEFNGICLDHPKDHPVTGPNYNNTKTYLWFLYNDHLELSCKEVLYATLMQSILTVCAILAIVVSQFVVFLSIRVLDRMSQGSYDYVTSQERNNFKCSSHSSNVHIMSEM